MSTTVEDGSRTEVVLTAAEFRERLRELPPSAKLIAKVLETDQPLSQGELAEESLLPDRTVRYALNRLEDAELVSARYSFRDARKQVYYLTSE
ncbi:transcriptional regulator [Halorhabdus sp. CBA1104]|jgi:DNA-binding MarR family transcriptional regulator|uniref:helix-turn-helix domain-containing protein n=1 Tax=unclassified Halorhabdus TaxID=2621901 RepID=UPI0012B2BBA3|nr:MULTISPECIES: helix-turn-helix domain-containing protein [unclassified Halorhabdus]QGN06307.1 transcriptional regulator [Halorhabdus sp. CBA1104]